MLFSSRVGNSPRRAAFVGAAAMGALLAGFSAGCGGGGGNSSGSGLTSKAATVNLYVTDGFKDDWSQVLVTLYKIEVSTDKGATFTTVYTSDSGQSVDLAALGQAAQLLSSVTMPTGTITNVRVTLGDSVSLTAKSDGSVKTVTVDSSLPNVTVANGMATFTYAASTAVHAGKLSNLVVDFNLAAFELVSGKIRPALAPGSDSAFDAKQKVAHVRGTVSHYVAGSGFDLTPDCGQKSRSDSTTPSAISVTITSDTTINASSSGTALADGVTAMVEGSLASDSSVTATVVQVVDASSDGDSGPGSPPDTTSPRGVGVLGTVASIGSDGTSFTLTVRDGDHVPSSDGTITVQTSSSTTFQQGKTTAAFSAVTTGSYVFATGTLDPATSTLTAKTVSILPAAPAGGQWPGPGH